MHFWDRHVVFLERTLTSQVNINSLKSKNKGFLLQLTNLPLHSVVSTKRKREEEEDNTSLHQQPFVEHNVMLTCYNLPKGHDFYFFSNGKTLARLHHRCQSPLRLHMIRGWKPRVYTRSLTVIKTRKCRKSLSISEVIRREINLAVTNCTCSLYLKSSYCAHFQVHACI